MSDEPQYLYMTSTGWRSGNPHRIEIWYVEHEGRFYIVSEMRERSHWVQNVQRNPAITVEVGQRSFHGHGRVIDRAAEPTLAAAVAAKMDAKYEWSDGLIVELAPEHPSEAPGESRLKIYFAAAIRGGRTLQKTYQAIVEDLRQAGHAVLSENVAFATLADDEWTDEAIYAQDTAWLDECDALVAEVTTPSLGVGYEVGYALHHANKPVLCLCQRSAHLSAMIAGNTHPRLTVLTYEDVPGALRAAHHWLAHEV